MSKVNKMEPMASYFGVNDTLKKKYDCIALITHSRHLEQIEHLKDSTLIVTCSWHLLVPLEKNGFDAIYFEYGLRNWEEQELESMLYVRASDWLYTDGVDESTYKGVSLGKLYVTDISLLLVNYTRLYAALSAICDEFSPRYIYFFDYRSESGLLDEISKIEIVDDVCRQRGIQLINYADCPDDNDDQFPELLNYGGHKAPVVSYPSLRNLYGSLIELLSDVVRAVTPRRDKVLVVAGGHLSQTLSKYTKSNKIIPVYFSTALSNRPREILSTILRGSYLAKKTYSVAVSRFHRDIAKTIADHYISNWERSEAELLTRIVRRYIKRNIFGTERLGFYVAQIDLMQSILNQHRPKRILIDSLLNAERRISMELAKDLGVKIDYIWHGYWQTIYNFDALGGDSRSQVLVDRVYSWGEQNERWLNATKWKGGIVRVGNPFSQKYSKNRESDNVKKRPKNILVLQYTPGNQDIRGLNANQYGFFVDIVRRLDAIDDFNIRLKLHPGVTKKSYYSNIKDQYGLNCEIRNDSPFEKHVQWADIVIGPVQSGAHLEVLSVRKPYYSVIMSPHSKMVHAKHSNVYEDLGLLVDDIRDSVVHDQNKVLDELTSLNQFPNPALALMDALGND